MIVVWAPGGLKHGMGGGLGVAGRGKGEEAAPGGEGGRQVSWMALH